MPWASAFEIDFQKSYFSAPDIIINININFDIKINTDPYMVMIIMIMVIGSIGIISNEIVIITCIRLQVTEGRLAWQKMLTINI